MFLKAGIVDQNIQVTEAVKYLLNRLSAKFRVFHIAAQCQALAAFGLDGQTSASGIFILVQIHNRHIGTFSGIEHGNGPAYARVPTGNHGYFSFQLAAALVAGGFVAGGRVQITFTPRLFPGVVAAGGEWGNRCLGGSYRA